MYLFYYCVVQAIRNVYLLAMKPPPPTSLGANSLLIVLYLEFILIDYHGGNPTRATGRVEDKASSHRGVTPSPPSLRTQLAQSVQPQSDIDALILPTICFAASVAADPLIAHRYANTSGLSANFTSHCARW